MTEIRKIEEKLDVEFSKLIRDKGFCERCAKRYVPLDTAHIISRNNHTLRWNILNALCFCRDCHNWSHANPKKFNKWLKKQYPERHFYLEKVRGITTFWKIPRLKKLLIAIKEKDFRIMEKFMA